MAPFLESLFIDFRDRSREYGKRLVVGAVCCIIGCRFFDVFLSGISNYNNWLFNSISKLTNRTHPNTHSHAHNLSIYK